MSGNKNHTHNGNGEARSFHQNFDAVDALDSQGAPSRKVATMPVHREAVYYNMNHKRRGIALIFNHEYFSVHELPRRIGAKADSDNLSKVLKGLGFCVTTCDDYTCSEVMARIQDVAKMDHTDDDCVLVAVLTHGDLGILYAKDAHYKSEILWQNFTADKCPSLAGKPKLFVIQACRGSSLDGGITLSKTIETDGLCNTQYTIPIHADFLIAYSTVSGYVSWRNRSCGSWFIQALCEELHQGSVLDILTILTFVNRKVAVDFESNNPDDPLLHPQKQMCSFTSMLTRLLVFEKKNNNLTNFSVGT